MKSAYLVAQGYAKDLKLFLYKSAYQGIWFFLYCLCNIHKSEYKSAVKTWDTNSGASPVCCENINKRAPGPIALLIQTAPDPFCKTV